MNDNKAVPAPTHTVNDLMIRWQCPRKLILEAIHDGRLAAFRVGKRIYRVRHAEVLRFELAAEKAA